MRGLSLAAMLLIAGCGGAPAEEASQSRDDTIAVAGHFGADGDRSEDMSGLACDWQSEVVDGALRCLAIDDEGGAAQWAVFDGQLLRAGRRFDLFGAGPPLGSPPIDLCGQADPDSREFDGEAAAFDNGVYYLTGSHGCSRSSHKLRAASFIVARIAPDEPGLDVLPGTAAIELSHRLAALFAREPALANFYGASLRDEEGLNIEGLAVRDGRMVFGLRAPVIGGRAYLFETTVATLFERDIAGTGQAIPVALGPGRGIRDLAFLPDGRLLILSGPAQEQAIRYRLHLYANGEIRDLIDIAPPGRGKAEAIAIIGVEANRAELLVLFDGVADGGPRRISLDLP